MISNPLGFYQVLTRTGICRQDLEDFCQELPRDLEMVEIGSYAGDSMRIFVESGKVRTITCVDPWKNDYDGNDICSYTCPMQLIEQRFDEHRTTLHQQGHDIRKMKMTSDEASRHFFDGSLDLVYIDGCHTYEAVRQDLGLWAAKVRPGGLLAGHDYGKPEFPGVTRAVLEGVGVPLKVFCGGSWFVRRTA